MACRLASRCSHTIQCHQSYWVVILPTAAASASVMAGTVFLVRTVFSKIRT